MVEIQIDVLLISEMILTVEACIFVNSEKYRFLIGQSHFTNQRKIYIDPDHYLSFTKRVSNYFFIPMQLLQSTQRDILMNMNIFSIWDGF